MSDPAEEEIALRCREDIVRQVWAHFRVREKPQHSGRGHVPPGAVSFGQIVYANREELRDGGYHVADLNTAKTLKVDEKMPDFRSLLFCLEAVVDAWAEDMLGRPLTDAERSVWGSERD